LEAQNSL